MPLKQVPPNMKVYTEVTITPHHAGFGMFQRGELQVSLENSFKYKEDIICLISDLGIKIAPLSWALKNKEFLDMGVEDIRGRIYNEPANIYVILKDESDDPNDSKFEYMGIEETEVSEDFFN